MRAGWLISLFLASTMHLGCSNGGHLAVDLHGLVQSSRGSLTGSCTVSSGTLVLGSGYCVEFYGGDAPEAACAAAGGGWSMAVACAKDAAYSGRCLVRAGGGIEAIYFATVPTAIADCRSADGLWETGAN